MVSLSNHPPISDTLSFDKLRMSGLVNFGDFAPTRFPDAPVVKARRLGYIIAKAKLAKLERRG